MLSKPMPASTALLVATILGASLLAWPIDAAAGDLSASPDGELRASQSSPNVERRWAAREPTASAWSVSATGPVLTILGGLALVGGAGIAAIGASVDECSPPDSRSCHRRRIGFILGGGGAAGLLGGLGLGLGIRFWKQDLGTPSEEFEDDAPRADGALRAGGIALVVVGSAAFGVGFFGSLSGITSASEPPEFGYFLGGAPGVALLLSGATAIGVGAPMLFLGNRKLPKDQCVVEVGAGLGTASLTGRF
jgi:hypothetical protein